MHETFEHTADLGLRVRADGIDELFADAARGLFAVMVTGQSAVQKGEELSFNIVGDDFEELLHDWLAELLYTFHARRLVLSDFRVNVKDKTLTAAARGEPIDPARHEIEVEVKAITWHGLKVERCNDGWTAEVIVDI
ncbi:MAG: archease [Pirellulales bacterium]|nr:archease [Pirellulales bacterium]